MTEMVERVRMTIADALTDQDGWMKKSYSREDMTEVARAAIEAMREPTESMIDKATDFDWGPGISGDETDASPNRVWQAMIDAALVTEPAE